MGLPGLVITLISAAPPLLQGCPGAREAVPAACLPGSDKGGGGVCLTLGGGGGVTGLGTETLVDPRVKSGLHKRSHV